MRVTDDNDEPEFLGLEFYYKFFYPAGPGSIPASAIDIRNFDDLLFNGFKRHRRMTVRGYFLNHS